MTEVETLRVSLARIAQALGFSSDELPGRPLSWFYGDLCRAAETSERGWNYLALRIIEAIEDRSLNQDGNSNLTALVDALSSGYDQPVENDHVRTR